MSIVRPFPARVAAQRWAPRVVTAMSDSLDETGADPLRVPIDPAAYDARAAALYVYRQHGDGAAHTGVVCDLAIQAFVHGQVRGHEAVHRPRVDALVRQHATTSDRPALLTLIHRAGIAFTRTLDSTCRTPPILDFAGPGGLQQTVWRVANGPVTAALTEELSATVHYIADGHHRVAAALEEWRRSGEPAGAGLLCVVHPLDGLRLSAFHRRVAGPVDPVDLLELLTPAFQVRAVHEPPTPRLGSFGLYAGRRWFELRYRGRRGAGSAGLDVAVLQTQVIERLVDHSPGPSYLVEIAPGRTSVDELTHQCDSDGGALFTLAPPPLDALTGVADAGEMMPPKTTYFEPKPCAGIFLRPSPTTRTVRD